MSDPLGKPRGNAVLKTLPAETQAEIMERLDAPKATYTKVRVWLLQDRCIATSERSLRDFYSWYKLRYRWEKATARSLDVQEMLAAADPTLSPEKIEAAGQLVFLNEAIEMGGEEGAKAFVNLSRLRLAQKAHDAELDGFKLKYEQKEREIGQRERQMALDREKFDAQERRNAEAREKLNAVVQTKGGLTPETIHQIEEALRLL